MNYTDEQLKRALAKMLPEHILNPPTNAVVFFWCRTNIDDAEDHPVLDTELLHLCWLVEREFDGTRMAYDYSVELRFVIEPNHGFVGDYRYINATWQQKVIALAAIKKVEIV